MTSNQLQRHGVTSPPMSTIARDMDQPQASGRRIAIAGT